jgi:putative transposase
MIRIEDRQKAVTLIAEEEADILAQCHRPEFADLPPDQIVVRLMDEERLYLASVSSFY